MDIEIGSNLYRNSNGTIEIEGVPQIQLARHATTGALLVSFALFDSTGRMLAKMVDSSLMFNERRAYEVMKTDTSLTMKEVGSGKILLKLEAKAPNVVAFSRGEFHTIKGRLLQVSSAQWQIDKQQKSGVTQDVQGGAASIG